MIPSGAKKADTKVHTGDLAALITNILKELFFGRQLCRMV